MNTLETFLAEEARRAAQQDQINVTAELVSAEHLADVIREVAVDAHSAYPQYDGMWDDWQLGRVHGDVRTKGGLRFADGDWVLYTLNRYLVGFDGAVTAYSVRGQVNCSMPIGAIRWWEHTR